MTVGRTCRSKTPLSRKVTLFCGKTGGRTWARTKDPLIKSQLLYQLSYASVTGCDGEPCAIGMRAISIAGRRCKPFSRTGPRSARHQRVVRRFWRSIDIRMPSDNNTVICAEPPKLTSGSGMPTTGAIPITIDRLIAT